MWAVQILDRVDGTRQKLLAHLSEKGVIGLLSHIRTILLHRIHERISQGRDIYSEVVPTAGKVELSELTINSANRNMGVHYAPTPRLIFEWLHEVFVSDKKNTAFIDVGAGRGRIVMMAMEHPYAQVIGCEFAKELAEEARQNIASHSQNSIKARSVEIEHGDATEMNIPELPCIFFMFNPFGADVMQSFLKNALRSYTANPRAMTFVYVNPINDQVFEDQKMLIEKKLPAFINLKMALFSPYSARIYVTTGTA